MIKMSDDKWSQLIASLKDPNKTAFDILPSGHTVGELANRYAFELYDRQQHIRKTTQPTHQAKAAPPKKPRTSRKKK